MKREKRNIMIGTITCMFIVVVAIICGVFRDNSNTIFYFMHKEIAGDYDLLILPRSHLNYDRSLIKHSKELAL